MKEVKKVVLIGASGFVGSALLNETLNRGFEVTAVVRHPEKIKIENESLKVTKADVSSLEEVYEVCKGADAVSEESRSQPFSYGRRCRFIVYCARLAINGFR